MNLKDQIRYNATEYDKPISSLDEMAQAHIDNAVIDAIKDGNFEDAAHRYIDNHGSAKVASKADATINKVMKGQLAKTMKADPEKVKNVSNDEWEKFKQAYVKIQGTEGQTTRSYKTSKGQVQKATGEVKTSSQSTTKTMEKLDDKIQKVYNEWKAKLESAATDEEKEDAKSHMSALQILSDGLQYAKKGKAPLEPVTQEDLDRIKEKFAKIGKNYVKKQGKEAEVEDQKIAQGMEQAHKNIMQRITGIKDLEDIEDLVQDFRERKAAREARKGSDVAGPDIEKLKEEMIVKGEALAEGLAYEGVNFWENYVGSALIKMFNEDVKKLGAKEAANSYIDVFGEETLPIFKYLAQNTTELNEAANIKGLFLFETVGNRNLNNYLTELNKIDAVTQLAKKGAKPGMLSLAGSGKKVAKFLKGAWDKIKEFGGPIVKRLGLFLGRGVKWAKNIAQQGLEFIWSNPVTKVAVPAIALAGTIGGGIALVNKLRKRAGKDKLSKQEEAQFRETAEKKEDELEKLNVA